METQEPVKKKQNALNDQERFSLWNAMNSLKGRIEQEKWTYSQVLDQLNKQLEFKITLGNLKKAAEVTGVKLHRDMRANKYRGHRLVEAEKKIQQLEDLVLQQSQQLADHEQGMVRLLTRMEEVCKKVNDFRSGAYRLENGRLVTAGK